MDALYVDFGVASEETKGNQNVSVADSPIGSGFMFDE